MNFSRWIWAGSVVNLLLNQFDKVIVAKLLGPAQLGAYQMSSKLAQMLLADAAIAMSQYLFPTFSAHHRKDADFAARLFRRYLGLIAAGLVVLVVILRFAAEPLFQIVLGTAWLPAVPLFRIFVVNMAIGAVIAVLVSYLRAVGLPKVATHASIIQAVVLLVTVPVATHLWGVTGIAWAMTVGLARGRRLDAVPNRQGGVMRILHLVLAPRLSGAEVLAKDLAIHQQNSGETVGMTSLRPQHDDFATLRGELDANGVECMFPSGLHGTLGKLWHLYQSVNHYRPDVVFAHATIPAFYARALPIAAPVVYVMHSATNDFERGLFRRIERVLSRRARAVIAVSPANIDDYVAAVGRHPSMQLIPNGVDMARFSQRTERRSRR